MPLLEQLPPGSRVAVIRLRSLGDCVLTTPAIRILKNSRPDLRIAVVVEPRFAPVFTGNPDIEAVLPPGLVEIRAWKPDLILNLHGGTRSLVLTALSGARWRAGFAHHRACWLYDVAIPRAQEILGIDRKVHTAEHLASAMFYLGAHHQPIPRAQLYADEQPTGRSYAVIHPVAAIPEKTWPAEHFALVAEQILASGLEPIFIAGPDDDLSAFTHFRIVLGAPLSEVKSLLAGASLFVGNDSGPAHMAAAFGIPTVVVFGNSDPIIWAPWKTPSKVLSADPITRVHPDGVLAALEEMRVLR